MTANLIHCRAIQSVEALLELQAQWEDLYERSEDASPFQHPDWVLPWWRIFGHGELLCFALCDRERLVALAPLFLHAWKGKRQITFLGNGVSDRLGFLAEPGHRQRAMREFFEAIAREGERWDLCDLQELPVVFINPGPPKDRLQWAFAAQSPCSKIQLPNHSDGLHAAMPHGLRRNLRRYRNKLDHLGSPTFHSAQNEGEFLAGFDALLTLHCARWRSQGLEGMLGGVLETFHREAAVRMWRRNKARCFTLSIERRPVAALYGFLDKRRFWSYQSGFDPEFAAFSPGSLILDYAISEAIAEGAREFDFLRGGERYKRDWGATFESSYRLLMWQAEAPALSVHAS